MPGAGGERGDPPSGGRTARHDVATFYLLAFAISWPGWIPSLLASRGVPGFASPLWLAALVLPGAGPAAAAALAARFAGGPADVRDGAHSFMQWRAPAWTYAVALVVPPLLVGGAAWLAHLRGVVAHASPLGARGLLTFAVLSLLANPCEEIGWRGFALRRLQARHAPIVATLVVAVLWAAWHVPLFFVSRGPLAMAGIPAVPWAASLVARSFVMTRLFNASGRSVAVLSVFHVALNVSAAMLGVPSYGALAVIESAAAVAVVVWGGVSLGYSNTPR